MKTKEKVLIFRRSIALVTLWIFLCSNVSFALRPQSAKDRIPTAAPLITHEQAAALVQPVFESIDDVIGKLSPAGNIDAKSTIIDLRMGRISKDEASRRLSEILSALRINPGVVNAWIIQATQPLAMATGPEGQAGEPAAAAPKAAAKWIEVGKAEWVGLNSDLKIGDEYFARVTKIKGTGREGQVTHPADKDAILALGHTVSEDGQQLLTDSVNIGGVLYSEEAQVGIKLLAVNREEQKAQVVRIAAPAYLGSKVVQINLEQESRIEPKGAKEGRRPSFEQPELGLSLSGEPAAAPRPVAPPIQPAALLGAI